MRHDRREDVELEVALCPGETHRGVVAEHRVTTIVIASDWVGLTLPGMIDEPGSFSGIRSSPIPVRGPDASHRTSLAIFISAPASVRSDDDTATSASCDASCTNRLSAWWNFSPSAR